MWRKARVGGWGQRDGLSSYELSASDCFLRTRELTVQSEAILRRLPPVRGCRPVFLVAGGKLKWTADVFQMAGRGAPFRPQRENDPTPTHSLQASAQNTAKHVHNTSLCAADSCCSRRGSLLLYTHTRAWAVVSFSSSFKVQSDSNQSFLRSSVLPSLTALNWHSLCRWTQHRLFMFCLFF